MQRRGRIGRCNRCKKSLPLTRHHIVPRSEGGSDDEDNIELVCRPCHDRIHRARTRPRASTKAERRARKTRIRTYKAQVQFECTPNYHKCKNCDIICLNYVLELLVLFFQWLDEVTRKAYGKVHTDN